MSLDRLSAALSDHYRIERELGAGGMATVYLAQDLRHDRRVAIKVLRPELAAVIGAERFLAEIKTTANLQHPHILALFDSGKVQLAGTSQDSGLTTHVFYVMPFVEGESLRDRLNREKQLPIADAVRIATEVASALDYAHRHGVIHRDIKPENILLHDGQALVADFGIALAAARSDGGTRMTETGMSLGTPHYMSPEQAMGERDLDARTDVYALGCVTYEMLVGEPPFSGPTAQAIVAKVMTATPEPITTSRKTVPPVVEDAVHTALQKLPADRFATAKEFAEALAGERPTTRRTSGIVRERPATAARWLRDWRSVAALVALVALGAWTLLGGRRGSLVDDLSHKEYIALPDSLQPAGIVGNIFALSQDGHTLAYVMPTGGTSDLSQLVIKRSNQLEPTVLPGTQQVRWPSFSPDGTRLVYVKSPFTTGALMTIPVAGGTPRTLVADSVYFGASWGADGNIYYSRLGSLFRIPESGGTPEALTSHGDSTQLADQVPITVPGGRGILFVREGPGTGAALMVLDLKTREVRQIGTGTPVIVLPQGVLVLSPDGTNVEAVRFDLDKLEILGTPIVVAPPMRPNGFSTPTIALSASGSMVLLADVAGGTRVVWVDRQGNSTLIDPDWSAPQADSPRLAPDGRRLALAINQGLVIKQLDHGPAVQITPPRPNTVFIRPEWSPDGRSLMIYKQGEGKDSVFRVRDDGIGGPSATIVDDPRGVANALWSPDGRWIVYRTSVEGANGADIYAIPADGSGERLAVATSLGGQVTPVLSPDGRWIAYGSDESGMPEIYLRPFPNVNDRLVKVSIHGGKQPRWARDGELFFIDADNEMMAVNIRTSPTLDVGLPRPLFAVPPFMRTNTSAHQQYDVTADGQRFVMISMGGKSPVIRIDNWLADYPELRK